MDGKHSWHLRAPLTIVLLIWIGVAWIAVLLIGLAIWGAFGQPPLDGPLSGRERFLLITTPVALATATVVMIRVVITARDHELSKINQAETQRHNVEQRITDLHIRAAGLLESDKAHIRVTALHDLERLAQANPHLRQSVVDEFCFYLKQPYEPPAREPQSPHRPPAEASEPANLQPSFRRRRKTSGLMLLLMTTAVDYLNERSAPSTTPVREQHEDDDSDDKKADSASERRVRLHAQTILARHLRPNDPENFWTDIDLNLSEAALENINLSDCEVRNIDLSYATLYGEFNLQRIHIRGRAFVLLAHFHRHGSILFQDAIFDGPMSFNAAELNGLAVDSFEGAKARARARLPQGQRHLLPRGLRLEAVPEGAEYARLIR